ncbi:MAG: inositol monophosphatase [Gammaproteobacteria bacterium]|jgi:myo-inositol-1(or 4)-monophosphatase|nr:inositol monophosphatase [Gammaproteobacteria bacterium]
MDPKLTVAVDAARKAGNLIARAIDRLDKITINEKSPHDFVTSIDIQAEELIIETLRTAYPDDGFLAEESGKQGSEETVWIIDPLDGTMNFVHGVPQIGVSIALQERGKLSLAVVYDPFRNELFTACRGKGAQVNGNRMRVSQCHQLSEAMLGTGFPYHAKEQFPAYIDTFSEFFYNTASMRRPGSASLDLAYVASGRFDGFWEIGLAPWDLAAGVLLIKEAGGLIGDFNGSEDYFQSGNIVTANPKLFREMLKVIKPRLGDPAK